ncbi:cell division protein [Bifidobacterium jacchi]|uniref:cell division protein n=1 Tax=Bifidobacterium jacchi TaxID=2490545 RepID=UPI003BA85F7C
MNVTPTEGTSVDYADGRTNPPTIDPRPSHAAAPQPTPAAASAASRNEPTARAAANAGASTSNAANAGNPKRRAATPFPMDALPDLRDSDDNDPDAQSRDEFTTVYDIIDRLEATLDEAKSGLFSPSVVRIDRDTFREQLDTLKKMLPVQLERASALMREAERRLESAQTQANAVVASAQSRAADMVKEANEQAQFLAGQENVTALARQKARAILDQAQSKADRLTKGADQYCTTVMEGLQQQLGKLGQDVQAGLNVLYERQQAAGQQLPHLDHHDYPEG